MALFVKRVYRARAYCRTAGVALAHDEHSTVWLPIEKVVRSLVRVEQAKEGSELVWNATNPTYDSVAEDARAALSGCNIPLDVHVTADVWSGPAAHTGLLTHRALVLATAKAVALALEEPVSTQLLSRNETPNEGSGLLHGTLVKSGKEPQSRPVTRYTWMYIRPTDDVHINETFGNTEKTFAGFPEVEPPDSGIAQLASEVCTRHLGKPVAVVGGAYDHHPVAALYPMGFFTHPNMHACASELRRELGPDYFAGPALSAVPDA